MFLMTYLAEQFLARVSQTDCLYGRPANHIRAFIVLLLASNRKQLTETP